MYQSAFVPYMLNSWSEENVIDYTVTQRLGPFNTSGGSDWLQASWLLEHLTLRASDRLASGLTFTAPSTAAARSWRILRSTCTTCTPYLILPTFTTFRKFLVGRITASWNTTATGSFYMGSMVLARTIMGR